MRSREFLNQLNNPDSVAHGVLSATIVAGLTLIEPRRLSTARRLAYRGATAALTAWTVWVSLRPSKRNDLDLMGPLGRAAVTIGGAGVALGMAEPAEAIDARLHDGLIRAGAQRPRLWLAAGGAILSLVAWLIGRFGDRERDDVRGLLDDDVEHTVEVPEDLRRLADLLLSATDGHGAVQLRDQLAQAQAVVEDDGSIDVFYVQLAVPVGLALAVPGTATFPVMGRFRALGDRSFDVRIFVEDGRLASIHIDPGSDWTPAHQRQWDDEGEIAGWPRPDEVDLLIETPAGVRLVN